MLKKSTKGKMLVVDDDDRPVVVRARILCPQAHNVEACLGGDAAGFGFFEAMRPQLSVCFAAPCSLANHRPHSRAQGVAPQASQLRNGITSAEGMVSSKVQIWQLTVWGKGFERQASAMVRSPLFVFFSGLGEAVRAGVRAQAV